MKFSPPQKGDAALSSRAAPMAARRAPFCCPIVFFLLVLLFLLLAQNAAPSEELSMPDYAVVHSSTDGSFEVRRYAATAWMASVEDSISFSQATLNGFRKLFRYIQGANVQSVNIPMTAPVLTGVLPSGGPFCASTFVVRFFVSPDYRNAPPEPLPALRLRLDTWPSQCLAARTFPGFAGDDNVAVQASALLDSLHASGYGNATSDLGGEAYAIAQYNSPFEIVGRRNEVWIALSPAACDGKPGVNSE